MKKILWILIIGGALWGGYALYQKKEAAKQSELANQVEQQEEVAEEPQSGGKKMAFESFLKNDNRPYQCTVSEYLSDFDGKGTVYIDDGKLRIEMSAIAEGRTLNTSIIVKDGFSYLWMPPTTVGYKMRATMETNLPGTAAPANNYSWSPSRIGEYDCQPWTPDAAKFNLPTNVTFRELSEAGM